MKLICAIIAMATIATSVTANQIKNVKSSQSNKTEQDLRRLSGQWLRAIAQRDTVALNDILAEEVIITDAVGKVHNKAEELVLRGRYVHNTGYNNTVENVRFYGDAAVVTIVFNAL